MTFRLTSSACALTASLPALPALVPFQCLAAYIVRITPTLQSHLRPQPMLVILSVLRSGAPKWPAAGEQRGMITGKETLVTVVGRATARRCLSAGVLGLTRSPVRYPLRLG